MEHLQLNTLEVWVFSDTHGYRWCSFNFDTGLVETAVSKERAANNSPRMRLIQPFEPEPLINHLTGLFLTHWSSTHHDDTARPIEWRMTLRYNRTMQHTSSGHGAFPGNPVNRVCTEPGLTFNVLVAACNYALLRQHLEF